MCLCVSCRFYIILYWFYVGVHCLYVRFYWWLCICIDFCTLHVGVSMSYLCFVLFDGGRYLCCKGVYVLCTCFDVDYAWFCWCDTDLCMFS